MQQVEIDPIKPKEDHMPPKFRNILLDRDGTVIQERHYLSDPEGVELIPGVGRALQKLCQAGCRLFLVTNQSGLGRNYFTLAQYEAVQQRLQGLLLDFEVKITDTAMCPHAPGDGCSCRKPLPGLWAGLRDKHGLRAEQSVMIGDKQADLLFARNAGLGAAILVLTGHGREQARKMALSLPSFLSGPEEEAVRGFATEHTPTPLAPDLIAPDLIAPDLAAAANWLLG